MKFAKNIVVTIVATQSVMLLCRNLYQRFSTGSKYGSIEDLKQMSTSLVFKLHKCCPDNRRTVR